jgi:predicted transcriptional regulator
VPNRILSRTVVINGDALREARLAQGLSQGALAKAAKVSQASVSNYETRAAVIDSRIVAALARRLGITVDELVITDP